MRLRGVASLYQLGGSRSLTALHGVTRLLALLRSLVISGFTSPSLSMKYITKSALSGTGNLPIEIIVELVQISVYNISQ